MSPRSVFVIPGRRESGEPGIQIHDRSEEFSRVTLRDLWLWIPGAALRAAPE